MNPAVSNDRLFPQLSAASQLLERCRASLSFAQTLTGRKFTPGRLEQIEDVLAGLACQDWKSADLAARLVDATSVRDQTRREIERLRDEWIG